MIIGFSAGDFGYQDIRLTLEEIESSDSNAFEMNIRPFDKFLMFKPTTELKEKLLKFDFLSIHASKFANPEEELKIISKLKGLDQELNFNAITVHPDIISDFELWDESGLPIAMENMDKDKRVGKQIAFFKPLMKYDFKFVIDLQHIYENDPSMRLGQEFLELFQGRLSHIHLSGSTTELHHSPIYLSENKEAIISLLKETPQIPIILEGILGENRVEKMKKELEFIQKILTQCNASACI